MTETWFSKLTASLRKHKEVLTILLQILYTLKEIIIVTAALYKLLS